MTFRDESLPIPVTTPRGFLCLRARERQREAERERGRERGREERER